MANKKTNGKVNGTNCAVSVYVRELGGPERVTIQPELRLRPAHLAQPGRPELPIGAL